MSDNIISERIKIARESLGITMAEASRRLNLSKIGYCRYEYGERTPSIQTLEVIAQCFGTSVEYLIGETDDMSPDSLIVSKHDSPALFELVNLCNNENSEMINRLLKYYTSIVKKTTDYSK